MPKYSKGHGSWPIQDIPVQCSQCSSRSSPQRVPMLSPPGAAAGCGSDARRLWGTRPAPLKTQQNPKQSTIMLHIAYKFHIKSQWHSFIVLSPQSYMCDHIIASEPRSRQRRLKPSSFKMDKQIEQASIWWCSSDTWCANLTWEVSCVEIISVRQCRLAGWREQPVAGLFLLFQEGWALVSAVQSSS